MGRNYPQTPNLRVMDFHLNLLFWTDHFGQCNATKSVFLHSTQPKLKETNRSDLIDKLDIKF